MSTRRWALLVTIGMLLAAPPASAGAQGRSLDVAVIGDAPYGAEQVVAMPALIGAVNADPRVGLVLHLGDIKTGGSPCTDAYFAEIRALFDGFRDPFVYTPGDNEWTDCHRPAAGGYVPTERLEALRDVFFPEPGRTLGRPKRVQSQADEPGLEDLVENRLWVQARTVFATLHVVGSNNGLAPWFGAAETDAQRTARLAEFDARMDANLAWLDRAFAVASDWRARGLVLAMQADMWDGAPEERTGFAELEQAIATRAAAFGRPVLLLQGDSHRFKVDRPLPAAPNVTRVVVEGETVSEWLRVAIAPRTPEVFTLTRETVAGAAR